METSLSRRGETEECELNLLYRLGPGKEMKTGSDGMSSGSATTSFADVYWEDHNWKIMSMEFKSQADSVDYFIHQQAMREFEGIYCLRVHFNHSKKCRVVMDGFRSLAGIGETEEREMNMLYRLDPEKKIDIGGTGMSFGSATTSFSDRYWEDHNWKIKYIDFKSQADSVDWFMQQRTFCKFEGSDCLRVRFLHSVKCRVLVDDFHTTLAGWVDQKYAQWVEETEPRTEWWPYIREEFIGIFRAVTSALRTLHRDGKYHRNLKDGILVRKKENDKMEGGMDGWAGILYNMRASGDAIDYVASRKKDCDDLMDVVRYVTQRSDGAEIPEINDLFMLQLSAGHMTNCASWYMHPALLWNEFQEMDFLLAAHGCLIRRPTDDVNDRLMAGFPLPWTENVRDHRLRRVLTIQRGRTGGFDEGKGRLRFWHKVVENDAALLHSSTMDAHRLVKENVDNLIIDVVAAVNDILFAPSVNGGFRSSLMASLKILK